MPNPVESVTFNSGDGDQFALVAADNGNHNLDLIAIADDGTVKRHNSVPRRATEDYGPEGGGHTWHD